MYSLPVYAVISVLIFLFSPALSLRCYQCNSREHPGCLDVAPNSTDFLKPCGNTHGNETFCRKTIQKVLDNETVRVYRSCGWIKHKFDCRRADSDFKLETSCQCFTDACNSAPQLRYMTPAVIVLLILSIVR